jgi:hypothetical protein
MSSSTSSTQETREKNIRQQIQDLDTQASTLNEAISLLRATLSHSSHGERCSLELLEQWQQREDLSSLEDEQLRELIHLLLAELWCSHLLYNHALRQLYPRLVEGKRQMMHHWVTWLQKNVAELPDNRQPLVRSLLDNCVQGTLSAGVQQLETAYGRQLEQVEKETHQSPRLDITPLSMDLLLDWLENNTSDRSGPHTSDSATSTEGDPLAKDHS